FSPAHGESIIPHQIELYQGKFNQPIPEYIDKVEQPVIKWHKGEIHSNISNSRNTQSDSDFSDLTEHFPSAAIHASPPTTHCPHLKIIGQTMGTYIIAEDHNALVLIDQHAAHERIVYEKLKKRYKTLNVQSQNLIAPEILELNFREADLLLEMLDDLKELGMIIEPFGDTSFVVKSVPSIIDEKEIKPIILDMIEAGLNQKDKFSKETWLDNCLILMACHNSIRANATLNEKEIQQVLFDLENCENSRHCPHGRPIIVTLTKKQMGKLFKRVL
ncbi:MAG: DNA mismatch repair protein MutL, partial [Desulfobacula sp.]|nr:DNA mismatch repair protein MutL [Desulfobacula sp.]